MRQTKRQFVEEYIKRVEQAVKAFNEADPASADQVQNDLFDLLVEIRNVFDSDIPSIDSAIFLRNGTAIRDANSVLGILRFFLINNEDEQADQCSPTPQTIVGDKIFISHRSIDKKFAEIIEDFLTSCGVPADKIFCSSLPGNDIEEEISREIKLNLQQSVINIVLLSKDYYESAYCQNEAGIIWFLGAHKIIIALPEINENCMLGFLNSEHKIRRLDNADDVFSITDIIKRIYPSFITSSAKLKNKIEQLSSRYAQALENRVVNSKMLYSDSKGYYYATVQEDRGLDNGYRCLKIDGLLPTGEPYKDDETHWLFFSADRYSDLQVNDRVKFIPTKWPQKLRDFPDLQNTRNVYIEYLEII